MSRSAALLLAAALCSAPVASFAQTLPQAYAGTGEMLKSSESGTRSTLMATLYARLFDLRDRQNRKQVQIDLSRHIYRVHIDRLKVLFPDAVSEDALLAASLKETGYGTSAQHEQEALVTVYRELTGVNGSLRAMRDIVAEIVFVEQRIARHAGKGAAL